jgi:hypothetical protein
MFSAIRGRPLRPDDLLEIREICQHYHRSRKSIENDIRAGRLETRRVGPRAIRIVASSWVRYWNELNPDHPERLETDDVLATDTPVAG